ncbi:nitroreductase family protein [Desulfitobacterium metallireducens]|uniref:Nitroreductase n=1 Tax=Desulfitobacterium metallireducens DSM 15288 TaxID=871968 RepID=W0EA23_9FIRM|nr:nitroreductase family protein [Desulfitobacterium metallireducens]AHF07685.1 nitroreductase [Desulfitobacterium metallireducens DSM 15288]
MSKEFMTAVKDRRTYYALSKESPISDARIQEIIEQAAEYAPTAFNSQGGRMVLLLGEQHDKLWDITMETLRKIAPVGNFESTENKIKSFRDGYGTVLFFEDQSVVKGLQEKFALYADNFPIWSLESAGLLQYIVWTALEEEGLGASLQHYNPLIDAEVQKTWDIPNDWKLLGQMPFGKPTAPAGEKQSLPLEGRIKVFK